MSSQELEAELSGLLDYVDGRFSGEFEAVLDQPLVYECHICTKHLEDMLLCNFCVCNVCPKCALVPASDEAYCSLYCLSNSLDETLYSCCICKDTDVVGTDILVCWRCEKRVCQVCTVVDDKKYYCCTECID